MSEPVHHFFCANHPGFATRAACVDCGRPFCESCLTEMSGQLLCGWCRDQRLGRIQQRSTVNPATVILFARIFNGAALLITIGFAALMVVYVGYLSFEPMSRGASGSSELSVGIIVAGFAVVTVLSLVLYLPPAIGLGPGRGWLWAWQMVALCFAVLGGCVSIGAIGLFLMVPAIVLFVFWIKPEVRDYCAVGG